VAKLKAFEVKAYPEMWKSLEMNVERFEKMRCVLGDVYHKTYLMQENRPKAMEKLKIAVLVPDEPDIVGALGAALYAANTENSAVENRTIL
jgi:hypothetical protein